MINIESKKIQSACKLSNKSFITIAPFLMPSKEDRMKYFEAASIHTSNEVLKDLLNHPHEMINKAAIDTLIKKKGLHLFI